MPATTPVAWDAPELAEPVPALSRLGLYVLRLLTHLRLQEHVQERHTDGVQLVARVALDEHRQQLGLSAQQRRRFTEHAVPAHVTAFRLASSVSVNMRPRGVSRQKTQPTHTWPFPA